MEEIVIRSRRLKAEDIQFIQQVINTHWNRGRKFISQELCRLWDWRQRNGYLRDQACLVQTGLSPPSDKTAEEGVGGSPPAKGC